MFIVIDTKGYPAISGHIQQITLPGGKLFYTDLKSAIYLLAKQKGWAIDSVEFYGGCHRDTINLDAHGKCPIQINGVSVVEFLHQIASEKEYANIFAEHGIFPG